jgi:WD40 repeat protein
LAFSPNGEFLASACRNIINIWNVLSGKLTDTLHGHTFTIHGIVFSGFIYDNIEKKLIDHLESKIK